MIQIHAWNGAVSLHVQDLLPAATEPVPAPKNLNGIVLEEAVHTLVTVILAVSLHAPTNAHMPDKKDATELQHTKSVAIMMQIHAWNGDQPLIVPAIHV